MPAREPPLDWSLGLDQTYWDPMPWISRLQGERLTGQSMPLGAASEIFNGSWEERNWRNVPGPIYGAMTDNCWVGRLSAPRHVLYGDDIDYEQEFLYRQPETLHELLQVLDGAQQDPFAGWACDGDERWTVELVRDWWRERGRLKEWIARKVNEWSGEKSTDQVVEVVIGLRDYSAYVAGELALDLRRYCYWLEEQHSPAPDEALPEL